MNKSILTKLYNEFHKLIPNCEDRILSMVLDGGMIEIQAVKIEGKLFLSKGNIIHNSLKPRKISEFNIAKDHFVFSYVWDQDEIPENAESVGVESYLPFDSIIFASLTTTFKA